VYGDLLLFRTTLIPGTIDQLIVPRLANLKPSIHLAYCPETIMETRAFEELENNPMILAGLDKESIEVTEVFLKSLSKAPIYKSSNFKTAEMVKVIQNIHRDVNVALINEISEVAYQLGVDIYELITLVNTHPRVTLLQPGPGVGGYCLPNALGYLKNAVDTKNCPLTLMDTARKLNEKRPFEIVQIIADILKKAGKVIEHSTIALVGLAMKDFCADCRNSPALDVAVQLINSGAKVKAYDPVVPVTYVYQVTSLEEALTNADCLVILANQKGLTIEYDQIKSLMAQPILVVDTRNVFPNFPGIQIHKL
jgi:UDP-N-acetyl-D-mannosaminuronic acid dehydrogenase